MDDPDADYIARVVAARAPEIADYVVSHEVVTQLVETVDVLSERLAAL